MPLFLHRETTDVSRSPDRVECHLYFPDTFVNICARSFFLCTVIRIILSIREWNFRKQSVFTMRNCSERDTAEGTVTETPMFPLLLPSPTLGCSTENILNVYSLAIYSQVNNTVKYSFRTLFLCCN